MSTKDETDPLVMYLVIRSDAAAPFAELAQHVVTATMRCVGAHAASKAWAPRFAEWEAGIYRKVVLRAKGSAWAALLASDHGAAPTDAEPIVRVFPPRRKSEAGPLFARLQTYAAPAEPFDGEIIPDGAMGIIVNPAAAMTGGKTLAQIAHAAALCAAPKDPSFALVKASRAWTNAGFPCAFLAGEQWSAMRANPNAVVVRDAGLTEINAGTETVVAVLAR